MPNKTFVFDQIKKLMGWCPMKNSHQKDGQEDFFSEFKLENRNIQPVQSPLDMRENRIFKVRVSLFDGSWILWALIITLFTIIVSVVH
ncbi:MAG: DUF1673 family protein [Euryarchaeota archaeon]|nr:DUF1673 family protein [Euryarchaeota archaeon]